MIAFLVTRCGCTRTVDVDANARTWDVPMPPDGHFNDGAIPANLAPPVRRFAWNGEQLGPARVYREVAKTVDCYARFQWDASRILNCDIAYAHEGHHSACVRRGVRLNWGGDET